MILGQDDEEWRRSADEKVDKPWWLAGVGNYSEGDEPRSEGIGGEWEGEINVSTGVRR